MTWAEEDSFMCPAPRTNVCEAAFLWALRDAAGSAQDDGGCVEKRSAETENEEPEFANRSVEALPSGVRVRGCARLSVSPRTDSVRPTTPRRGKAGRGDCRLAPESPAQRLQLHGRRRRQQPDTQRCRPANERKNMPAVDLHHDAAPASGQAANLATALTAHATSCNGLRSPTMPLQPTLTGHAPTCCAQCGKP